MFGTPPLWRTTVPAHVPVRKRRLRAALATVVATAAVSVILTSLYGAQTAGQKPAAPAPEAKPAAAQAAANASAEYVGSETCAGCHDEIAKAFQKNPHEIVGTNKKWAREGQACESCHGPGSKHAESADPTLITNPAKLRPSETDKLCLKCHTNMPGQVGRIQSSHAKNDISCLQCHAIHKHGPAGLVPVGFTSVNNLCRSCHTDVWAQFQRPYRHRLPEGSMSCVDCHDPHGSWRPRMLQSWAGNERSCIKCHADKRGPFVFEHAPLRLGAQACSTCHESHGSANPRMLTRQEVRFVCLECHTNLPVANPPAMGVVPPAFHDLRSPRFRNCTICHQKIHGSYVDDTLLR